MNKISPLVFLLSLVHASPVMPFLLLGDPWPSLEDENKSQPQDAVGVAKEELLKTAAKLVSKSSAVEPQKYQAKTFSEAVMLLKHAEPGSHVEFPCYQRDKFSDEITGTRMLVLTEHGIQDGAETKEEELPKIAAKLIVAHDVIKEPIKLLSSADKRKKQHRQKTRYKKKKINLLVPTLPKSQQ